MWINGLCRSLSDVAMHFSLVNLLFASQHLPLTAQWYFKTLDATLLGVVNNSPNQHKHLIIINV